MRYDVSRFLTPTDDRFLVKTREGQLCAGVIDLIEHGNPHSAIRLRAHSQSAGIENGAIEWIKPLHEFSVAEWVSLVGFVPGDREVEVCFRKWNSLGECQARYIQGTGFVDVAHPPIPRGISIVDYYWNIERVPEEMREHCATGITQLMG